MVLAGPVLLVCWLERRLNFWQTATLALLAVGSVFTINHFAGDYGIKMLYYREFIGTPLAPGEAVVQFSGRDYVHALRAGIVLIVDSFFLPFVLAGIGGWLGSSRVRTLALIAIAYTALHFVIFPGWGGSLVWSFLSFDGRGRCGWPVYPKRKRVLGAIQERFGVRKFSLGDEGSPPTGDPIQAKSSPLRFHEISQALQPAIQLSL